MIPESWLDGFFLFCKGIALCGFVLVATAQWFVGYDRAKHRRPW